MTDSTLRPDPSKEECPDREQWREMYDQIAGMASILFRPELDDFYRYWIRLSLFPTVATVDQYDLPGVSPKDDAPRFVKVVDENHLLRPDRPGNVKIETLSVLTTNPRMGLMLVAPGDRELMRVERTATVTSRPEVLPLAVADVKTPKSAIVIEVRRVVFHCGKAKMRWKLWDPASQMSRAPFTSREAVAKVAGEMKELVKLRGQIVEDHYENRTY